MATVKKIKFIVLGIFFFVIMYQLMIPPIIGIANNGDFERIMNWGGLIYNTDNYHEKYYNYVVQTFSYNPNPEGVFYLSSEALLVKFAVALGNIIMKYPYFDIRLLGLVHSLLYLFGLYLILTAVEKYGKIITVFVSFLLFIFLLDVGYIAYFNSFYSEPSSLIFLVISFGLILNILQKDSFPRWMFIALTLSIIMMISSKVHNSLIGFVIALYGIRIAFLYKVQAKKFFILILSGVLLLTSFLLFAKGTPDEYKEWNKFHSVFYGILMDSKDPKKDLLKLNMDPIFSKYKGMDVFMENTPYNKDEELMASLNNISSGKVAKFYLTNPAHLWRMLNNVANEAFILRVDYLGNFEKSAGFPETSLSQSFDFGEKVRNLYPKNFIFIFSFFAGYFLISLYFSIKKRNLIAELNMLLPLMAMLLFGTIVIGDGYREVAKHLFLFNILFDLCNIIGVTWLFNKFLKRLNLGDIRTDNNT